MAKKYVYIVIEKYETVEEYMNKYGEWCTDEKNWIRDVFGTKKRAKEYIASKKEKFSPFEEFNGRKYIHSYIIRKWNIQ